VADSTVHLPLNFRELPHVRSLCGRTGAAVPYLLWQEWASARVEWRRDDQNLHILVNQYVGCDDVLLTAVDAGFAQLAARDGASGYFLKGFWELNRHLSEGYLTPQQLGGLAKRAQHIIKTSAAEADEHIKIAQLKHNLPAEVVTEAFQIAARFVVRIYRSRGSEEKLLLPDEIQVEKITTLIGRLSERDIIQVMEYLVANRKSALIPTNPYTIIASFDQYIEAAAKSRA
jgi:hypothetical protein